MKALRFVLAVPKACGTFTPRSISAAKRSQDVCGNLPGIWTDTGAARTDLGDSGLILGALFSPSSFRPLKSPSPELFLGCSVQLLATRLVRECWGAYFAILVDHPAGEIYVLSDPSGLLPVYSAETETHRLFTSHPALLRDACDMELAPSWEALCAHLFRPDLRQRATCLAGVSELAPGELVSTGRAESMRLWRPGDFMPVAARMSCETAAMELRELATSVMGAWAEVFGPVAVAASGGVDSSFICAALANAGKPFDCVTLATTDPSGDESAFVNMLAERLGARAMRSYYDVRKIDPLRSVSAGLARPSRKSFMAAADAALFDAARELDARVVFDGNGGDNLFCFLHSAAPVVDRLLCEGPGRGLASTFIDTCRLTGCDMPVMMRAVLRRLASGGRRGLWPADLRLLAAVSEDLDAANPLSPWFDEPVGHHRGKHDHLALIMRNQNHVNGLATAGLPRFSPLMSQPLVEYCLTVPTWVWCTGGINRAPARVAFAVELPQEVLARVSKAGPDSFVRGIFDEYRPAYRDLLLEGLLVRNGLVDREAVEAAFALDHGPEGSLVYRILDLAEAENWARSWLG